jgi:3-keto-disaccharide hydrolase
MKYILCIVLMAGVAQGFGQKSGWQNLFNGKDLSGWKQLNGKAVYEVKDGTIVGTTVANTPNSFLTTEKEYGDFILELEFKVDTSMNSGIQIRSLSKPDYQNGRVHGYQIEIDPSTRAWSGGIYDEARRGWLYTTEYNLPAKKAFRNNEWNKYRVECIGSMIRTWVNGVPVAHLIDDLTLKGFIALQVHAIKKEDAPGKQIAWRNIRIMTTNLKPSAWDDIKVVNLVPNTISAQEKRNGYVLLFNGKDTKGWRGAKKTAFPANGWAIKEGSIQVLPSTGGESTNGGDIVTDAEFGSFDFEFEFKLTEGGNSGVKYFVTESEKNSGSAIGLEYQVLDDSKHPDAKMGTNGNRTLASLYDLIPRRDIPASLKKIGEWNRGRIVVYPDNKVEHWLNGYKVVEYVRGSEEYRALVAKSKYKGFPNFGEAATGHLLLQDHGNAVSFRSLKIKKLKS